MSLDPGRVAEARDWLRRSLADLESAAILIDSTPPHPDTALFHSQQAAEKAWKAFLFWHDVPFRRTHDLRELGRACARLDQSLTTIAAQAEDLTAFFSACSPDSERVEGVQPPEEQLMGPGGVAQATM